MTLIVQQLIKIVPINTHLTFALNHTSKACLFKPETARSSGTVFGNPSSPFFGSTWPIFLPPPWLLCPVAELEREEELAVRAQDPATADKSSGLTSRDLACHCFQTVCMYCTNLQLQVQQNQSSVRPASGCTEPDHWHPVKVSEHQIRVSSPVRVAAKKGSSAWDLERLSPLIPWRKPKSRKRDQHHIGILADGYKIFWQVVCSALIGKYL